MIITIDASYLYFFVVRKQQQLVNNIHACDDTEGVSTAVHVMSVVQPERKFSSVVETRACFTLSPTDVRRSWRPFVGFTLFALGSFYADCAHKRIM